jgi:hypothetical protein
MDTRVVARDGQVVFGAFSGRSEGDHEIGGLYSYADGEITRIVDSTAIPGYYTGLGASFDYDGKVLVFQGYRSVQVLRDGAFRILAANDEPAPGGGTFSIHPTIGQDKLSVDDGHVAFSAYATPGGRGVYTDLGDSLWRLIGVGDVILGQSIAYIQLGPDGLSGNQITFWASFTNGNSGIFVATIPEPAISLLGISAIFPFLRTPKGRRGAAQGKLMNVA